MTLHENNQKAIAQWTAKDYANAYRDYVNNWLSVENWFSSFMPEPAALDDMLEFRIVCARFQDLGF